MAQLMKRIALAASIGFAVVKPSGCIAQTVTIQGAGTVSCGTFLTASQGMPAGQHLQFTYDGHVYMDQSAYYASWIVGYISGANAMIGTIGGPLYQSKQVYVDLAGTVLWIKNWCEAHPADALAFAVAAFQLNRWEFVNRMQLQQEHQSSGR